MSFRFLQYSSGSNITFSPDDEGIHHFIEPSASIDVTLFTCFEGAWVRIVHAGVSNTITVKDGASSVASLLPGQETTIWSRITSAGVPGWPVGSTVIDDDGVLSSSSTPAELPDVADGAAKGDILVFDGSDWQRLSVGANGTVLTADSAEALGVKWA